MGTTFTVYVYATDERSASALFNAAFEEIERVDETLSNYRDTSELSRINRLAAQEPVTTDPEVFSFLQHSLDFARYSGGAFDISVGKLMRAWGFFRGQGRYPTPAELEKARAEVGWQYVQLDAASRTVRFTRPGVELDPGGIGKGYAVDRVVAVLQDAGVEAALVDAGSSSIYALGAPPGKDGWAVRVPRPGDKEHTLSTVILRNASLSTSGSYEKFFRLGRRTYCHIMDPRTGEPVQGVLQATIIAPLATDSDALTKVAFVLGPEKGTTVLSRVPGTSCLWVLGEDAQKAQVVPYKWPAQVD